MYIANYLNSADFAKAYRQAREAARPVSRPAPIDVAGLKASLKEVESGLAKMKAQKLPATVIQQMEQGLALQKNSSLYKTVIPLPITPSPEDPSMAIKRRLEEYLKLAATVDFNAVTRGSGRHKKFTTRSMKPKV
ncbi:hypothetical protein LL912_02175 [Niabella sp. CC-SYL272]|uniref:hypothetical protein n=1 Tax=Niabella agricola TaxID=2891571 RepID=UPI001F3002FE|nr:hypothetical protein [Niabella agricola]MCF3107576.1 hypothetical protein [Niabella agricola]